MIHILFIGVVLAMSITSIVLLSVTFVTRDFCDFCDV